MTTIYHLQTVAIQGYRPFRDFRARLSVLEVLVGANGAGKSSLFEFLRFLRDGLRDEVPPEIVPGAVGQQVFHSPGAARFAWEVTVGLGPAPWVCYGGELLGPVGRPQVIREQVASLAPPTMTPLPPALYMEVEQGQGRLREKRDADGAEQEISLSRLNRLALASVTNPSLRTLYMLREYIAGWRFYGAYGLAGERIRRAVPVQQEPLLAEDGGNLAATLHYLMTEHQPIFDELQQHLRAAAPGFVGLTVKVRGGPGEVMAFWRERGVERELSLADLSDGILRLICWMVLCLQPNPPSLICIDEPDQGVHPRTLPILAGLFEKACERTQFLIATHSLYFLTQFDLSQVAVMRKDAVRGGAKLLKPHDSSILHDMLADFGPD